MSATGAIMENIDRRIEAIDFEKDRVGLVLKVGDIMTDFFRKEFDSNFDHVKFSDYNGRLRVLTESSRHDALNLEGQEYVLACDYAAILEELAGTENPEDLKEVIKKYLDFISTSFDLDEHDLERLSFEIKKTFDELGKEIDAERNIEQKREHEGGSVISMDSYRNKK